MLPHNDDLSVCAPAALPCLSPWAAPHANTRRAWLTGKILPEDTVKQTLFELSQFVLSCKLYVSRPSGVLINLNELTPVGCKSKLLFAKIAMAIWFQVSGVRCQVSAPPLGASTQFDRKRNFGRPSFIQGVRKHVQ